MSVQARKIVHADIKPENPPERAAHYLDVPNMAWETTKFPGIKIKVLYTDDTGITTALFKLEPGAVVPLHEHHGGLRGNFALKEAKMKLLAYAALVTAFAIGSAAGQESCESKAVGKNGKPLVGAARAAS